MNTRELDRVMLRKIAAVRLKKGIDKPAPPGWITTKTLAKLLNRSGRWARDTVAEWCRANLCKVEHFKSVCTIRSMVVPHYLLDPEVAKAYGLPAKLKKASKGKPLTKHQDDIRRGIRTK